MAGSSASWDEGSYRGIYSAPNPEGRIDDGLMALIHETSGGDDVHGPLMRLPFLADPDSKYTPRRGPDLTVS